MLIKLCGHDKYVKYLEILINYHSVSAVSTKQLYFRFNHRTRVTAYYLNQNHHTNTNQNHTSLNLNHTQRAAMQTP